MKYRGESKTFLNQSELFFCSRDLGHEDKITFSAPMCTLRPLRSALLNGRAGRVRCIGAIPNTPEEIAKLARTCPVWDGKCSSLRLQPWFADHLASAAEMVGNQSLDRICPVDLLNVHCEICKIVPSVILSTGLNQLRV